MKNKFIFAAALSAALVISNRAADVSRYLVSKGQEHAQTNAASVVTFTNEKPFRFLSFVDPVATGLVSSATLKLPSTLSKVLTNDGGMWMLEQGFTNKNGLDTAYAAGKYQFTIVSLNDGTNKPALTLAADNYPAAPRIGNWADLQAIEPAFLTVVNWGVFTNGTTNDFIMFQVNETNGDPVVATSGMLEPDALNGTNVAVQIPADALEYDKTYDGYLLFMKRTALAKTNYAGADGVAGYYRQTKFPLTTLSAPPTRGRIQFSVGAQEVAENAGVASITITRAGTENGTHVDLFTSGGTATAGVDYETYSDRIQFDDGEDSKTITLPILDDYLLEGNETVSVWLANVSDGSELGGRTNLLLTIKDNELTAAGRLQFSLTNFNAFEISNRVTVTVNRIGGSAGMVTASYITQDITAEGGSDYGISGGTIVFSNGVTSRPIIIPVVNDALDETNETFRVKITATSGGAALGTNINSTVTIADNDTGGAFSFKPVTLTTNENAPGFLVTVIRTGGTAAGVTVDYETHDGTAVGEDDYAPMGGTLTFGSNVLSQTFFVGLVNDILPDGNEFFTVTLANATGGATISTTNTATLNIRDDESSVSFTNAGYIVSEATSNLVINVIRSGALTAPASVSFATLNDSAIAGTDYIATNGVLTFPTNTSVRSFIVKMKNNTVVDETRSFLLTLSNPQNGLLLGALTNISVTITNEDRGGSLRFSTNNYTVSETATNAAITLLRSGGIASGVTVKFKLEQGSADSGEDYTNVTQFVTFNAGETNKRVLIPLINDTLVENSETVLLSLEDVEGGASLGSPIAATLNITSEDIGGVISLSRTNYSAYENGTNLYVMVNRTGGKASNVTVRYNTRSGVADNEDDFTDTDGELTFGANQTNKLITIPIVNDTLAEGNETFSISLSEVDGGGSLGSASNAVLTIIDDESSISISNSSYTVSEGATNAAITLVRSGALVTPVSVNFATLDDSAIASADYIATNGTLIFPSNVVSKTILVRIVNDTIVDGSEKFVFQLSNPQGGVQLGSISDVNVNITDNDIGGSIRFSTNGYAVSEAGTNASITLLRTGGLASGVTVKFKVEQGSADRDEDYTNVTQIVTFNAGETNKRVLVPIINDTIVEGAETILLSLENADGGASLGSVTSATLTITDNDLGGTINFASASGSTNENAGNLLVNVRRLGGAASGVTVKYFSLGGTATQEDDFTETQGTLTFGAGETNKTISVPILNDTLAEGNEQFSLVLTNVQGGAVLGTNFAATLTIVDDESSISISNAAVSVSESGTNVIITLVRSGALLTPVSVDFATSNLTATAGSDYGATNGTVTFAVNTPVKTIRIPIVSDGVIESDETFKFSIFNPQGGVQLGTVTNEIVTIVNDDFAGAVSFTTTNYSGMEGSNAIVTLTRTGGLAGGVSVYFIMSGGSAFPALDYTSKTGYITFAAGQTTTNIVVPLATDSLTEPTETVAMFLVNVLGGLDVADPTSATLNIANKPDPNAIPVDGPLFIKGVVNGTAFTSMTNSAVTQSYTNSVFQVTANWTTGSLLSTVIHMMTIDIFPRTLGTITFSGSGSGGGATYSKSPITGGGQIWTVGDGSSSDGSYGTFTFDAIDYTKKRASGRFTMHMRETTGNVAGGFIDVTGSFRIAMIP